MSMVAENYDDVLGQLRAAGLIVDALELGRIVRCRIEGDREKRGWYALHEVRLDDGAMVIVGSFGIWRGNEHNPQKIQIRRSRLTEQQREAIRARIREDQKREEARRRREMERAAQRAAAAWAKLLPSGHCGYLERKGVKAYGVRFTERGSMVIPMLDAAGRIHGLQVIYGDEKLKKRKGRDKDFWPAGVGVKGTFYLIGSVTWLAIIAEGYATAASIHEATGHPVAVAWNAGNLLPVAQAIHKRYPWARILIAADDDSYARCKNKACGHVDLVELGKCPKCETPYRHGNTGLEGAEAAALAVGGAVVRPRFAEGSSIERTDFNDLHAAEGLHSVRSQIEARLLELGWIPDDAARSDTHGGAGAKGELKPLLSVDEAVERFSLVYPGRGTLFDHQEHELVPKSDVLDLLEDHGWREWKRHPRRRVVRLREVGFDPTCQDSTIKCNLWGGWPTTPKEGNCAPLLELLEYLCSGEPNGREVYQWVLKWLAYPIQHPGAKMKTALVFHGPQGVGKNLFFESVMAIYGPYGRIIDQAAIEDKFNDWASKKLFLIADEVVARAELFHMKNKLKGLITGDWIRINPKNVAAHDERNHVNIVFLSNETQPLVLERDDRRFAVIWTPEAVSEGFYREVAEAIDDGAIAALHHYLRNLELGDFKPWTRPPMTKAKRDLISVSLDSVQRFVAEWESGETPFPFCPAASMDLYRAYLRWCRENGVQKPRESNHFLAYVGKLKGWTNQQRYVYADAHYSGQARQRRVVIPDEASLARAGRSRPESQQLAHWLTDCVIEFAQSLEDHGKGQM